MSLAAQVRWLSNVVEDFVYTKRHGPQRQTLQVGAVQQLVTIHHVRLQTEQQTEKLH